MDCVIKVKNLRIKDLKNIRNGEISSNLDFNTLSNSDLIGIYGQNGSGKTAFIEAFSLLKNILEMQPLPEKSNHLVYFNEKEIDLFFEFSVNNDFGEFFLYYNVKLKIGKEKLQVLNENLSYKENQPYMKPKSLIEKSNDSVRIRNKDFLDFNNEDKLVILLAKEMANANNTSFIFNKNLRKLYSQNFSELEMELFKNLFYDFNKNFHIINDMQTGLILANIIMPFSINLKSVRGQIPYGLNEPMVLPDRAFSDISKVIKQINVVLLKIIPGLQILINTLNSETMENGKTGTRFEFLSQKNDNRLPLRCESAGILKLISILSTLIAVYNKPNSCVVIDELDSGIFEFLLGELLEIISESGKGQLIFTSHNLRALEVLSNKNLWFTTTNENNRFIRLKGIKKLSNSRDIYIRAVQLGGQKENLYNETDIYSIKKSFRKAGRLDV